MLKKLIIILSVFTSTFSHAIAVSSLFEVADHDTHTSQIKVINNDQKDMFISLTMSKVKYVDGKKTVTKLNKDNIADWKFSVSPAQIILKPGQQKSIRLSYKCEDECVLEEDEVFAVDVTPVPYSESGESAVAVAFGYKVYFLVPATKVDLSYKLERLSKDTIKFKNDSNTMLNAVLNQCTQDFSSDCIFQYRLLPHSERAFKLPEMAHDKKELNFTVINGNEEIIKHTTI